MTHRGQGRTRPDNGNGTDAAERGHDIIVVGTSTGGVEALTQIVHALPEDLPAAVCVVLHMPPQGPSRLPNILSRLGSLPAAHPKDGESIELGHIYVAPPDRHLLVERGRLRIVRGPKENRVRPAIDPLFRSAALAYGPRVVGVVLTGALDDGTSGLLAIKRRGGVAVVQDPQEALIPSMPESALAYVDVDHVERLADMAALLTRLAHEPANESPEMREATAKLLRYETNMAEMEAGTMADADTPGAVTALTCPECGGPIYELHDGKLVRFRCQTGHAFTAESMAADKADSVEEALWSAVNTLMENAQLTEQLARDARYRGHARIAARFDERMRDSQRRAELIRALLSNGDSTVPLEGSDTSDTATESTGA